MRMAASPSSGVCLCVYFALPVHVRSSTPCSPACAPFSPFATPLPPSSPQVGKETGGKKLEEPHGLKANEMAEVVFEPCQPLVVDHFKACEGLSRIAFLDGNTAVMLGKVVAVSHK